MGNYKNKKDVEAELDMALKKQNDLNIPRLQTFRVWSKSINLLEFVNGSIKNAKYKNKILFIDDEENKEILFFNEFDSIIDSFFREDKELILHIDKGYCVVSFRDEFNNYIKALEKKEILIKEVNILYCEYEAFDLKKN